MNKSGEPELERSSSVLEPIATVTQEEKAVQWIGLLIPVIMAVSIGIMALMLAAHRSHSNQTEVESSARNFLLFLIGSSVLFFCLPILFFYKMIRRKKRRGSIYLAGAELEARRAKRKMPEPLWRRIAYTVYWGCGGAFFAYMAIVDKRHQIIHSAVAFLWLFSAATWVLRTYHYIALEKPKSLS
jgi:hypothetical protein